MNAKKKRSRKTRDHPRGRRTRSAATPTISPDPSWVRWAFLGALGVATIAFFWSFVVDSGAMLFGTDMLSQAFQSRAFAIDEIRAGRGLPSWNPFVFAGLPYLSILPYPVYYPTSLLYFVLPLHRAIGWTFMIHFLVAGATMYAFARELKLARGAAVIAGVSYAFTGYLVSHLYAGQDGRMFAMSWTPALLLFAERAISRSRPEWFLGVAAVAALQVFTPHVQMMYFAAMGTTAYVGFRLLQVARADINERKRAVVLGAAFAGAYGLAALLTLIEIWPTFNMLQFSHRADRGYAYASSWSMPVRETIGAIVPAFQGYLQSYWGTNPFKLHTEYLGVIPLLLAALAVAVRRTPRVWFFAGLGGVALLFAWGAATPLHKIFYHTLPVMKSFRAPAMMYSVVALSVATLAGLGAQCLYDRRTALSDRSHIGWTALGAIGVGWTLLWFWTLLSPDGFMDFWAALLYGSRTVSRRAAAIDTVAPAVRAGFGILCLVWWAGLAICRAAITGRLQPLIACGLLALLALGDLWVVDRDFYGVVPIDQVVRDDPAVDFLQAQSQPFRVLPLPSAYGPNDLMLYGIESVTGSQNFRLSWWDDLVGEDLRGLGDAAVWPLLDLRYLVSGGPVEAPGFELVHESPGGRAIYARPGAGPRAWIVRRTRTAASNDRALEALLDPAFDPYRTAVLDADREFTPGTEGGADRVSWVRRDPGDLTLDVEAATPGLLVMSEIYHPYWRATLDGDETEVWRANVALRSVPVPAGRHRLEMSFDDPYVRYGRWGTGVGVILWLGLAALAWHHRRDR